MTRIKKAVVTLAALTRDERKAINRHRYQKRYARIRAQREQAAQR